ncbi:MAG: BMP family ABC transporter substrate-binding protein [Lachnospiraceae bacterium]|nr:BMP family ABC transporter substrate-binding protein [Lachnospiraceae bacterium]
MKKKTLGLISLILTFVMIMSLAACGGNPVSTETTAAAETEAAAEPAEGGETEAAAAEATEGAGLKVCIVTTSGVDDGSFNQNCYEGIKAFVADHPDCSVTDVKEADLSKVIETVGSLVGDYDVFVLPGYNFSPIAEIVQANPDKYFIVVDETITDSEGNAVTGLPNAYTMKFQEQESGFFAGMAAALTTTTGKVAVVNGIAFPSNVNYQFGFMAGVNYANAKCGTSAEYVEIPSYAGEAAVPVEGLGTSIGGNYIGDFADQAQGKVVAQALLNEGVDVIFPAAGTAGNGCFTAIKEAGNAYAIGCDVDQYDDGANGDSNIILTSVLKVMDVNITKQLNAIYDGSFKGGDDLLGASTDSTGFVSAEGRQQLSEEALAAMNEAYELVKSGEIVPPSNFNGYLPDNFPGLE